MLPCHSGTTPSRAIHSHLSFPWHSWVQKNHSTSPALPPAPSIHCSTLGLFQTHLPGHSRQPYFLQFLPPSKSLPVLLFPNVSECFCCGTFSLIHPRKGSGCRPFSSRTHHHLVSLLSSHNFLCFPGWWKGVGGQFSLEDGEQCGLGKLLCYYSALLLPHLLYMIQFFLFSWSQDIKNWKANNWLLLWHLLSAVIPCLRQWCWLIHWKKDYKVKAEVKICM